CLSVRKDFLELIDEQEEVTVLVISVLLGISNEADESQRAPPQLGFDGLLRKVCFARRQLAQFRAEGLRLEQGLCEAEDRTISRPHNCKAPGTTSADRTQGKSWQQSGAHQTGFPTPGRTGNGQEVLPLENLLQPVCVLCAAEENRCLPRLKGP